MVVKPFQVVVKPVESWSGGGKPTGKPATRARFLVDGEAVVVKPIAAKPVERSGATPLPKRSVVLRLILVARFLFVNFYFGRCFHPKTQCFYRPLDVAIHRFWKFQCYRAPF